MTTGLGETNFFELVQKYVKKVKKSGSSLRVVIPSPIVKHIGLKNGDWIYFYPIDEGEAGMRRVGTPEDVVHVELERRQRVKEFMERLPEEIAGGNISALGEFKELMGELREAVKILKEIAESRTLHFSDENAYFADIMFELENEREDEFEEVLEGVGKLMRRRDTLVSAIENLTRWTDEGRVKRDDAVVIIERLKAELELTEERLNQIRKVMEE